MKATDNTVTVQFGTDASARTDSNAVAIHGMRITRDLHEAEAALDEALIRQANLLATMVRARRETAAGPFTGHDALLRLAASQKAVLDASGELARVHGKLREIGNQRGSFIDDCPPAGSLGAGSLGNDGSAVTLADAA